MCGINGVFGKGPLDSGLIRRMNGCIVHRGPDDEGYFEGPNVMLGMRRLSIIDIKEGGQPMYSEDGRYAIVFNGEIYNFREIKRGLEKKGRVFRTHCDTEVLLRAFEERGEACLAELNGMFAVAIYDSVKQELFLARDRVGKKPLFYGVSGDRFYFASEMKSMLEVIDTKLEIEPSALESYFALTYIPAPLTIYKGVFKLKAGHILTVRKDLSLSEKCYWDIYKLAGGVRPVEDRRACISRIRDLLEDAVRIRMIADVPLGAYLSGGIDSSIVVGLMSRISRERPRTFCIANRVKSFDESAKARAIARLFNTDHVEWEIHNERILEILEKAVLDFDEPFADSSALPTFVVAELARKHVTVVLTGDGGDEVFGGYTRYHIHKYRRLYDMLPRPVRYLARTLVNKAPSSAQTVLFMNKLRKIVNNRGRSAFNRYHDVQRLGFEDAEADSLIAEPYRKKYIVGEMERLYSSIAAPDFLVNDTVVDIGVGLEGDMLAKVDRMSMLNSVETRCPYLDYRVIELGLAVPGRFKTPGFRLKQILKDAFRDLLPGPILRQKKMGFGIPIGDFLRNELRGRYQELTSSGIFRTFIKKEYADLLFRKHCGRIDQSSRVWALFVFGLWAQKNESRIKW